MASASSAGHTSGDGSVLLLSPTLPAPLHESGGDEEETKEDGTLYHNEGWRICSTSTSSAMPEKERNRSYQSDEAAQSAGVADQEQDQDRERSTVTVSASVALRSPSRLATSLLLGRDRMARAARAWRVGARRAGILGGDGDEEDEDEEDDREWGDDQAEETKADPGGEKKKETKQRDSESVKSEPTAPTTTSSDALEVPVDEPQDVMVLAIQPMPRLCPARLAPTTRLPKMAQLWMFLDRIECISIQDILVPDPDDGVLYYVLDVYYYHEQHSIPTHRHHRKRFCHPLPHHGKPDFQIQQRFSSFSKLQSRLLDATSCRSNAHPGHGSCLYCYKLTTFLSTRSPTAHLNWKTKLFTAPKARKLLLSQFLTELIALACEKRDDCAFLSALALGHHHQLQLNRHVQRSVPGLLKKFLTVQTGENFMR